jgi:DNA-binding NtrC family response regulator
MTVNTRRRLLVVDPDKHTHRICSSVASLLGFEATKVIRSSSGLKFLSKYQAPIIVMDTDSVPNAVRLLAEIKDQHPSCRAILCSATPEVSAAVQAIRAGAIDYLKKPLKADDVETAVHRALAISAESIPVMPLAQLEREAITNAVAYAGGNKMLAAQLLGIGKTTLYRKLKEYRL